MAQPGEQAHRCQHRDTRHDADQRIEERRNERTNQGYTADGLLEPVQLRVQRGHPVRDDAAADQQHGQRAGNREKAEQPWGRRQQHGAERALCRGKRAGGMVA